VWVLPLFGHRKPLLFLQTPFAEAQGRLSPDDAFLWSARNARTISTRNARGA
jgi:hypothetical protein